MTQTFTKDNTVLAKLFAEEDIHVVYKQMQTAYFNPKSRELGLPIWDEDKTTPDIQDLMVCHEIAHALWTPLDMLEKAQVRKINHSFVNIYAKGNIMSIEIKAPSFPESVADGTIATWHKKKRGLPGLS